MKNLHSNILYMFLQTYIQKDVCVCVCLRARAHPPPCRATAETKRWHSAKHPPRSECRWETEAQTSHMTPTPLLPLLIYLWLSFPQSPAKLPTSWPLWPVQDLYHFTLPVICLWSFSSVALSEAKDSFFSQRFICCCPSSSHGEKPIRPFSVLKAAE